MINYDTTTINLERKTVINIISKIWTDALS
jgi:hypothetical protein